VNYINGYGSFVDAHTVKAVNKKGQETILNAKNVVIATGGEYIFLREKFRSSKVARAFPTSPAHSSWASAVMISSHSHVLQERLWSLGRHTLLLNALVGRWSSFAHLFRLS
jgi:hypothetical protein